jgi:hypothetical protein
VTLSSLNVSFEDCANAADMMQEGGGYGRENYHGRVVLNNESDPANFLR